MKKSEWMRIVARINRIWPSQPIQDDTAVEWFLLLEHLTAEKVNAAVSVLASQPREFPPGPGHIRASVAEAESDDAVWGEVWAEIQRAVRYHGVHRTAETWEWSSPVVMDLVLMVGWQHICLCEDPPGVREAQTREKWRDLRVRDLRERARAGLPGVLPRRQVKPGLASIGAVMTGSEAGSEGGSSSDDRGGGDGDPVGAGGPTGSRVV